MTPRPSALFLSKVCNLIVTSVTAFSFLSTNGRLLQPPLVPTPPHPLVGPTRCIRFRAAAVRAFSRPSARGSFTSSVCFVFFVFVCFVPLNKGMG